MSRAEASQFSAGCCTGYGRTNLGHFVDQKLQLGVSDVVQDRSMISTKHHFGASPERVKKMKRDTIMLSKFVVRMLSKVQSGQMCV